MTPKGLAHVLPRKLSLGREDGAGESVIEAITYKTALRAAKSRPKGNSYKWKMAIPRRCASRTASDLAPHHKSKQARTPKGPDLQRFVVPPGRFERPTPGLGNLCSIP